LEERALLSTIQVTSTSDRPFAADGVLTLRDAILLVDGGLTVGQLSAAQQALVTGTPDQTGVTDTIDFNLPFNDPGHVYYKDDGNAGSVSVADLVPVPALGNDGVTPITSDAQLADPNIVGTGNTIDPDWAHSWWSIQPTSRLPALSHPCTLDGYSQQGASRNTLGVGDDAVLTVELDGAGANGYSSADFSLPGYGFELLVAADNVTVQGLAINQFGFAGIADLARASGGPYGDSVQGCFIGTDPSGTVARPNGYAGVSINVPMRIGTNGNGTDDTGGGGSDYAERNIISGNFTLGVDCGAADGQAKVAGNYIGTDRTGTVALPNGLLDPGRALGVRAYSGSLVGVDGNDVDPEAERNVISGNANTGVEANAGSVISGNYIGTNAAGTLPLGNANIGVVTDGGALIGTDGNSVNDAAERNIISGNAQFGIYAYSGTRISGNYIGTDVSGVYGLGQPVGIQIDGSGNDIGLDHADVSFHPSHKRNVISGNTYFNVFMRGGGNTIAGNYIGTDANGTTFAPGSNNGIDITGSGNLIGTDGDGVNDELERNVISGNIYGSGIVFDGGTGNLVAGNYIGTDVTGTTTANLGNGLHHNAAGVFLGSASSGNQVLRNVIAGSDYGVRFLGAGISGNAISGNFIGTDRTGHVALGNVMGVDIIDSSSNTIGGTNSDARNLISGNGVGVYIQGSATANQVLGNWIGTDATGAPLGNGNGVGITDSASDNQIGGTAPGQANIIAFNGGGGGVTLWGMAITASGNSIRGNSIHDNGDLGIDLGSNGVTPNGSEPPGGPGPNNWQTFPVLKAAYAGSSTVVMGTLSSIPNETFTLDFYSNPNADPSGYGQGQTYLGNTTVRTDASGNAGFTATGLAPSSFGQWISATATAPDGSTSEFSLDVQAVKAVTATALSASANPSVYGQAATFSATVASTISGIGTPTGSVQFVVDGMNFGQPVNLVNGSAISAPIGSLAAGSHTVTAIYSGDAEFAVGTSANLDQSVNPAPLDIYANSDGKTYDGTTDSSKTPTFQVANEPVNTLYNGDTLSGLVQAFQSKNVLGANGSTLQVQPGYALNDGNSGKNYTVTLHTATGTITAASLTITGSGTQMYGGTNQVFSSSYSGLVPVDQQPNGNPVSGVLSGTLSYSTTVTAASLIGTYANAVTPSGVTAMNYTIRFASGNMVVTPQSSVQATYTGLLYVATASSTTSTATVGLSVTVKDISGGAGDIRKATVTFVNRADGSTIAGNLPVSLINPGDITTGTASYNWSVNIGTNNSQSFTVGIIIGQDYARNSSGDDAVVTVSKPQAGSATGGGYLVNQSSAGLVPGDPGANTNFGFDAKNGSKGLQGQSNIIVRYQGHVYQYNTTSITSLTFPSGKTADYAGTGTIQDITNTSNPITLYTGATLQVTMTDNGEPGTNDTIGFTIWTPAGALWFSSDWNGTQTVEQNLGNGHGGGNLQVRPAQELAAGPATGSAAVAPLTLDEIRPIAAEAIARWAAAGIDPAQLGVLKRAVFRIDDLTGSDLAWARQGVITLDRTADGYGWFIDPTPGGDSEFGPDAVNSPAHGHVDLLSVISHEMGHLLGYGEDESNSVTGEYLAPGVRHVPAAAPSARGAVSALPPAVRLASWPIGISSLVNPQAAANPQHTSPTDGLMALDPAPMGLRATGTQPARLIRIAQASVSGPGLAAWARPTPSGLGSPALDPGLVDALFQTTTPGSLFESEGALLPLKRTLRD
jgi:hypothetical protein